MKLTQRVLIALIAVLIYLAANVSPVAAQDARGTVLGRVSDESGSVIPGAEVRITNENTGVVAAAKANESGNFVLPYLIPGMYSLSVEMAGFKKWIRPGIQVRINDSIEVNVDLSVGSVNESIEVTSTTPLLSTAEASLGQVIDERRVLELPQFAGNAMDLVHLAPGTVNGTNLRLRKAGFNAAPSQFSTDGGGNNQNEFSIDGVSNTFSDGTAPRVAFSPPSTAISEFKVQTSAFDASLGHTMGSTVNVSTKSGTNELHGEAHEWFRHSALDAPDIFQNRSGQKISIYQDNRYGASAGAPIFIPKFYDGRNKSFWFFAYEANKFGNPSSGGNILSSVPTAKMHEGDLSEYYALGGAYQVYDPFSTRLQNGSYVRTAIPNNVIPKAKLDAVGMNFINLYPTPNQPGTKDFRNNYYRSGKALEDYWVWIARIDHAFNDNHRVFLRLHRDFWEEDKNRSFNNDTNGVILNRNNKGLAFDDVYVISPSFLMNFRYGLTFQNFPERRTSQGADLSKLGLSAQTIALSQNPAIATLPRIDLSPFTAIAPWESQDGDTAATTNSFVANFTKMHGNHNIRFGPEFRVYREARNRYGTSLSPQYNYAATYTKATDTSANPTLGGTLASMLMGIPAGSMSRTDSYMEQDKYFALYVHDDWKVSRKLTLNLGVRWELETPITERFNRAAVGFAGDTPNPLNDAARANYAKNPIPELPLANFQVMGGQTFANVGSNGRTYWEGQKNNFQPRVGFAYQWRPKTIIRGGYGIFTSSIGVNYTNTNQTGFSQSTPIQASLDNGLTYLATNANPFPTGLIAPPKASLGLMTNIGQGITLFNEKRKHPYAQRWSFGVQQELPMLFMIEASYVGNRTTRLLVDRELSYTDAQYLSTSPVRDQATIDFLGKSFPNPYYGLDPIFGKNTSRAGLLRPYSEFSSVRIIGDPAGYSWYHSLQTRIERRLANSFTVQTSYTWSKTMEAREFMNPQDPMPYESLSNLDRTHRLTGSGIWELPLGRGRRFGGDMHKAVDFIVGGWQLGGIYQHQSGEPLGFGNRIFNGDLKSVVLPKDQRGVDGWFVPAATAGFEVSGAKQLASNLRRFPLRFSSIRGPNQDRWDFSLIKNFRINERWNTQFRAETFNAMNHPNLSNPNTDPTSAAWGTITGMDSPRSWQLSLKVVF
ncbi:MAG: carboxypeptidase regulatory-like domain-containing protein [Bryobacterales bacterium]|nr:carboxypeptidase regulatory-like domain-containing protein [Bryobacterales bacterium]